MSASASQRPRPKFDWLVAASVLLLGVVLAGTIYTLSEVVRGFELGFIWPVPLFAIVWGGALATLKTRGWLVALLSVVLGVLLLFVMVGHLGDEIVGLGGESIRYIQIAVREHVWPSVETLRTSAGEVFDGFVVMVNHLVRWFRRLPQPGYDPVATLLTWGLAVWFAGVWASWFSLRRRQPLVGALPAILLAGFGRSLSQTSANSLLPILGATLALMVLASLKTHEAGWLRERVESSPQIRRNTLWAALALSVVLVFVSAAFSTLDVNDFLARLREPETSAANKETVTGDFGIQRQVYVTSAVSEFGRLTEGGLPRENLIGSSPDLSDQLVMRVRVKDLTASSETTEPTQGNPVYYFRALTYDEYTGHGWASEGGKVYSYQAGEAATPSYSSHQKLIQQEVQFIDLGDYSRVAHAVGDLAAASVDYEVAWRAKTKEGQLEDLFGVSIEADRYFAYSLVPVFSAAELRDAPDVYPDWVKPRYTQLPAEVSTRVKDLAALLTYDANNSYDKAIAIERYLRTFPYTLDLDAPPADREIADYFLFDLQRGYCDYYATAMVVMARAAGLPARFAVGYVGLTFDPETEEYLVTADQAHSWVEIYFPTYGWVSFEPTGNRPPLERPDRGEPAVESESNVPASFETNGGTSFFTQIPFAIGMGLATVVLGLLAVPYTDDWLLRRSDPRGVFARIYRRLQWFGERFGVAADPGDTPYEFSRRYADRVHQLTSEGRVSLATTPEDVGWLVEKCVQAAYSPVLPRLYERSQAIRVWARLRWRLFAAFVRERISRFGKRSRRSF